MSASEKLRALDAEMGGEDNEDAAYWLGRKMQEGLLPQIVAVVEAAERDDYLDDVEADAPDDEIVTVTITRSAGEWKRLKAGRLSLAALYEALS